MQYVLLSNLGKNPRLQIHYALHWVKKCRYNLLFSTLCTTEILNDEKCDLSNSSGQSTIIVVWNHKKNKFEIPRWPSELSANQCRPVSPSRQTGRHRLAGNSEGHRGNVIFLVNFVFYDPFWYFKSQFVEVAFFYHLKSQSYIVMYDFKNTT